jgi:hypothetical protein
MPANITGLETIFGNIIRAALALGGIALFIMIIIGGFTYLSSSGDSKKAESAKNTVTYAILGVVLLALAYLILRLIASFTGVNAILNFDISI